MQYSFRSNNIWTEVFLFQEKYEKLQRANMTVTSVDVPAVPEHVQVPSTDLPVVLDSSSEELAFMEEKMDGRLLVVVSVSVPCKQYIIDKQCYIVQYHYLWST